MKKVIYGVACEECDGQGYIEGVYLTPITKTLVTIKEWCEECGGSGVKQYKGNRDGVAWEGE